MSTIAQIKRVVLLLVEEADGCLNLWYNRLLHLKLLVSGAQSATNITFSLKY